MSGPRWYTPHQHKAIDVTALSHRKLYERAAPETLAVLCWCQMQTVWVPRATIMACSTESCGEAWCHE